MLDEMVLMEMADMLSVASDSTRLKILISLLGEDFAKSKDEPHHCGLLDSPKIEKSVNEIASEANCSPSLCSHQLKVLRDADLVDGRKIGRKMLYSLSDAHVKELLEVVLEHVLERL